MCSMAYWAMRLNSHVGSDNDCQTRVFPDGRDVGVLIWTASTAVTAVPMRNIAREMSTSGFTFGACYRLWNTMYVHLSECGLYPGMTDVLGRSRQTITSLLFLTVNLMTKDPPLWAFKRAFCQDKDGRRRTMTADGIWLGFVKRLASGQATSAAEEWTSVLQTVEAASVQPSERLRRFLRMNLKQRMKAFAIKGEQSNSAKRALLLLFHDALPGISDAKVSVEKRLGLVRLQALLGAVWILDRATLTLCTALIGHVKKRIAAPGTMSADELSCHRTNLQDLTALKSLVEHGQLPGGPPQGGIVVTPTAGDGSQQNGAAAGGAVGGAACVGGLPRAPAVIVGADVALADACGAQVAAGEGDDLGAVAICDGDAACCEAGGAAADVGHHPIAGGEAQAGVIQGHADRAADGPARAAPVGRALVPAVNSHRHHIDRTTN